MRADSEGLRVPTPAHFCGDDVVQLPAHERFAAWLNRDATSSHGLLEIILPAGHCMPADAMLVSAVCDCCRRR